MSLQGLGAFGGIGAGVIDALGGPAAALLRHQIQLQYAGLQRGLPMVLQCPAPQLRQPDEDAIITLAARLRHEPEAFDRWLRDTTTETLDEMCEETARRYLVEDLNPDHFIVRVVRIGERLR